MACMQRRNRESYMIGMTILAPRYNSKKQYVVTNTCIYYGSYVCVLLKTSKGGPFRFVANLQQNNWSIDIYI